MNEKSLKDLLDNIKSYLPETSKPVEPHNPCQTSISSDIEHMLMHVANQKADEVLNKNKK